MRSLCAQGCSLCAQGRSLCALGRSLCAQGRSLSAQGRSLCAACAHKGAACAHKGAARAHKGAACAQEGAACARKGAACAQLVRSINSIQVNFCRRCSPMSSAVRRIDALLSRSLATWKLESVIVDGRRAALSWREGFFFADFAHFFVHTEV